MILTARQVEEMYRGNGSNGQVTLPYRARLSPLAKDWLRQKKVQVGYADTQAELEPVAPTPQRAVLAATGVKRVLRWCDGPCGPAKAALSAAARDAGYSDAEIPVDPTRIFDAVRLIVSDMQGSRAAAAILLVNNGAAAMLYANRCPSLRAVLGSCLQSVEEGTRVLAANVLVVEHPHKTFAQARTMFGAFMRGLREPSAELSQRLKELATCA
jgi:hypothetical protein